MQLLQNERTAPKGVANSPKGVVQLQSWLQSRKVSQVHACLEATGGWSEDVALALHESGHVVSLVNPNRIKAFAQSEMLRTKTDRIDAASIARFCLLHRPDPWAPPAPEIRTLQGLVRRYQSLVEIRTEERNRLGAPIIAAAVKASIVATLEHLEREFERIDREIAQLFDQYPLLRRQRDLLLSIPGIGETTAARILGTTSRAPFAGEVGLQNRATQDCAKRCTGRRLLLCGTILLSARSQNDCVDAAHQT